MKPRPAIRYRAGTFLLGLAELKIGETPPALHKKPQRSLGVRTGRVKGCAFHLQSAGLVKKYLPNYALSRGAGGLLS